MVDIFSEKKRSEIMSKIRSKNTKIESLIFKALRRKKIYFQKHYKKIHGCPDIALPKKKKAIFIDGDFWHGKNLKELERRLPKKYWREKIKLNVLRDKKNRKELKKQGWQVLRVWEEDIIKDTPRSIEKIVKFLSES